MCTSLRVDMLSYQISEHCLSETYYGMMMPITIWLLLFPNASTVYLHPGLPRQQKFRCHLSPENLKIQYVSINVFSRKRSFHGMQTVSRYSVAQIINTANMEESITGVQACRINQFWSPAQVRADLGFDNEQFRSLVRKIGSNI